VRIFRTKWFTRFARREGISDSSLLDAIARAERGLVDADLGGGLIKQRVARQGEGRSGGYRFLFAYRARERAVFFFGFGKSARENLEPDEMNTARQVAADWLAADALRIAQAVEDGALTEVFE